LTQLDAPLKADWKTVVAIAASLAGLVGIGRFLTDYLGDVEAWATYEETDIKHMARNKVLDQSLELLTHVLGDPACERVTVIAHSLGTSVAHDALLALTRRNRAFKPEDPIAGPVPMNKIEHFVTMGSPIDKIEYFFESYSSPSHRYKRVVEALRGDIGAPPFTRNRHPYIHWINFWDQGDAISGALHSPASAVDFNQRVDNVHVANFGFRSGASHGGYFNNRTVIDALFRIIYRRDGSFAP
jgi:pimeloyl-ACP methyl ester carboxylesterase